MLLFIFYFLVSKCFFFFFQFFAVGTHWGTIHILDHCGNNIRSKELPAVTIFIGQKKKKEELPKSDDTGTEADTEKKEGEDKEKLKADLVKKDQEIAQLKVKAEICLPTL